MQIKKFKIWLALAFIVLACSACGMSEGQTVNLYVSQMTVYERRVEADAYDINKMASKLETGLTAEQHQELVKLLNDQQQRLKETLKAVEAARCPMPCEDIRSHYEKAFKNRIEHCQLWLDFLNKDCAKGQQPKAEAVHKLKVDSEKLLQEAEKLDAGLHEEKVKLARRYREVQLPETTQANEERN